MKHTIITARSTFEEGYVRAAVVALSSWLRANLTRILLGGFVTALMLTLLTVYFLLLSRASLALPGAWGP
jgi:hypothetical protein